MPTNSQYLPLWRSGFIHKKNTEPFYHDFDITKTSKNIFSQPKLYIKGSSFYSALAKRRFSLAICSPNLMNNILWIILPHHTWNGLIIYHAHISLLLFRMALKKKKSRAVMTYQGTIETFILYRTPNNKVVYIHCYAWHCLIWPNTVALTWLWIPEHFRQPEPAGSIGSPTRSAAVAPLRKVHKPISPRERITSTHSQWKATVA